MKICESCRDNDAIGWIYDGLQSVFVDNCVDCNDEFDEELYEFE